MISETTNLILLVVFGLANGAACAFTIITTNQALKKSGYYEANPISAWLQRNLNRTIWWAPKAAFYALAIGLCAWLPAPAALILVGLSTVTIFDLIGNLSALHKG